MDTNAAPLMTSFARCNFASGVISIEDLVGDESEPDVEELEGIKLRYMAFLRGVVGSEVDDRLSATLWKAGVNSFSEAKNCCRLRPDAV